MHVRSLGYSTDLSVLRAEGSSVEDDGDAIVVVTLQEPSYWWGNFVLVANPESIGRGIGSFTRTFPRAAHVAIGVDGTDGFVPPADARLGLEPEVSVVLTAPRLAAGTPVDAEVRALSTDRDWEGLVALRQGDGQPGADAAFHRARVAAAARVTGTGAGIYFGAFRGGRLVSSLGIVSDGCGTARFQHVLTRADHRKQGLASHLVATAGAVAGQRWGTRLLVITADPDGPAINLYLALGFEEVQRQLQLVRAPASR